VTNRLESYLTLDKNGADRKLRQAIDYCKQSIVLLANSGGASGEEYYLVMNPVRKNFVNLFDFFKYYHRASKDVKREFSRVFQDLCFIVNQPSHPDTSSKHS